MAMKLWENGYADNGDQSTVILVITLNKLLERCSDVHTAIWLLTVHAVTKRSTLLGAIV